jgi:hypothetical protein
MLSWAAWGTEMSGQRAERWARYCCSAALWGCASQAELLLLLEHDNLKLIYQIAWEHAKYKHRKTCCGVWSSKNGSKSPKNQVSVVLQNHTVHILQRTRAVTQIIHLISHQLNTILMPA